ncbi:hypothetical protein COLO4_26932 [Corchorus olitorius]|uniref:F-box domain-containing protein n=1 Tax=Corchorus olitorius TaxID=93759 RepID=A0A1R3HTF0_9ROSI|nr:hypothetical protein COLO4_26932 [Corchorus olitorius]
MGKKSRIIKKEEDIENDGTKLDPRKRELAPKRVYIGNLELDSKDYISRLPNDILYHIISKLPFEFAVQTTCLSTKWKDVWQKALLAMVEDASLEDVDITITNFLEQLPEFNKPRQDWGFKFNFGRGRLIRGTSLLVAITSNNTLVFDFSSLGKQKLSKRFDLLLPLNQQNPLDLLLRLDVQNPLDWLVPLNDQNLYYLYNKQLSPELIEVKSLHLKSMSSLACEAVSSLLSEKKLPFLESLTIEKCNGLRSLEINEAYGLLTLVVLDCPKLEFIILLQTGRDFKSFRYRGKSVFYQGAQPEDLMLDFRQGLSYNYDKGMKNKLSVLGLINFDHFNIVPLTILSTFFFNLQSIYRMFHSLPVLFKGRFCFLRELWWIDSSMEEDNVDVLLCFLTECYHLERLYVTIDPTCYKLTNTCKLVPRRGILSDLKLVKLEGFPNEKGEIAFVRRLIPLFEETPKIIAKSPGETCLRQIVKVDRPEKNGKNPYRFEVFKYKASYPDHSHKNFKLQ